MYQINFQNPIHVHFIGIGGISMSGIAKLLISKGFTVSGSDVKKSELTDSLEAMGAVICFGQRAENITDDVDVTVYTGAIHNDNPEFAEAVRRSVPILTRGELMGQIMKQYPHAVGISGMHGKTTTTSLLAVMLIDAGLDPTVEVGGVVHEIGGNLRIGSGDHFVAEACEYTNSFLSFSPTDAIILNIECEHMDFFKDIDDIRHSFRSFAKLLPKGGTLAVCSDVSDLYGLFSGIDADIVTYGIADNGHPVDFCDYTAANISFDEKGRGTFDLYERGQLLGQISLGLVGIHNVSNSLPAIAIALKYGVPFGSIAATARRFTGTERRFEYKGTLNGAEIYDDYAHHPTEIRATLTAALNYPHNRLITVFQPHTFSRTKEFLEGFVETLSLSDVVVMADIYSASRETDDGSISSKDIKDLLVKNGKEAYHFHSFGEIENFLRKFSTTGDLLITMGAGDIVNVGNDLIVS